MPRGTDFDFAELLAEAEARLDDQGVPEHFGEELVLAEGEEYTGRYRGEDLDQAFDPPRGVYLLAGLDGTSRFVRVRTVLERQMREAKPAVGDYLAIVRGQDTETRSGNALQIWGVSSRPCSEPLIENPETEGTDETGGDDEAATADDIPF